MNPLDETADLAGGAGDFLDRGAGAVPHGAADVPAEIEADVVEAGIRRQTGLGAGGAIEHGGQARLLDGLENRHLLRDAAPGHPLELPHAWGKVHAAREVANGIATTRERGCRYL